MNNSAHNDIAGRLGRLRQEMRRCMLCPRRCGADRVSGQKGACGLGMEAHCFREMIYNEEYAAINPTHQVYFSGCNLQCDFCSVKEYNQCPCSVGKTIAESELVKKVQERRNAGARTLNLLGGEPTVNLYGILSLLQKLPHDTSVVWNSNMYYSEIVAEFINGLVDVYLADFKCGNEQCARQLLGAGDYVSTVKRNIIKAAESKTVIVRHVVLPGHLKCCAEPVLNFLAGCGANVKVSIRGDYVPPAGSEVSPMEYTSVKEFEQAKRMASMLGLEMVR